ncbi:MAG: fibronectin type III domain-containing protein [Ignavibacteria bacterium]|nr:fibronectin type III domain-containing protein [Ignavibacteria bacterium]
MIKTLIFISLLVIILPTGLFGQLKPYASTPIILQPVATTSTSVLIPIVNTFPPLISDGRTIFLFEYFYWELATDSNFTKVVAYQLWEKNPSDACLIKRDTISVLIEGILPNTKFFFRVQVLNKQPVVFDPLNPLDSSDRRVFFFTFTSPILIQTLARSLPLAPRPLLSTNIAHNSFTLNWLPSPGFPTEYEVQVSPDSTFQSAIITTNTPSTLAAIKGLQPNTRYFYRARAKNAQGNSPFSLVASEWTLKQHYPFLADNITPIDARQARANYAYAVSSTINTIQADSLVALVVNANISINSAWFQDGTKYVVRRDGIQAIPSVLYISAASITSKLDSLGFKETNISFIPRFETNLCTELSFRRYKNFTPTSVAFEQNKYNSSILSPIYPNPSTTEIAVQADLAYISTVSAEIVDILGRRMNTSSEQIYASGTHELTFSTRNFANGTYILRMKVLNQASGLASYYSRQFAVLR